MSNHIPLTFKLWKPHGLLDMSFSEVVDSDSAYVYVITMEWKDVGSWEAALKNEASKQLEDDVKNFTNAKPIFVPGKLLG
ncbi:hypothetical protein EJ04DRAFT_511340 [Polyplosphaeria fusca]|uniref:ABM domain-containing protein n=1 Tax=Polyplosphaeria fusca TaxID=682080 RepID=A0A9P4QYQ8_9PLEO|nr:hypothetical protein EJ04DRAFT_511340 [Polyplosphaeria fusca]